MSEPAPNAAARPRWRSAPAQAAALWGGYWLLLLATGQPIDLRPVYAGWQNLPVAALRDAPFSSLLDLHIQPPLWNVVLGFAVAWSPFTTTASMGIVLFISGCVLAAAVAAVLGRLGVSHRWTLVITAAATMNTHLLVYAFNAGYDLPVAALLGVLMWVVVGAQRPSSAWYGVAAAATTIAMIRSLYHPVWALMIIAIVGWELRHKLTRRQVLTGLMIPTFFIGGWITVNGVRHGTPTLSSWTGMNLLRSVYPTVSKPDLRQMYEDGDISGIALSGPFRAYSAYEPYLGTCEHESDDLAMTITTRPIPPPLRVPGRFYSEQAPNFNYECYIQAYDMAGADAWAIMRKQPQDWVKARVWASDNWFEAPPVYEPKRSPLWRPTDVVTGVVYVRVPHPPLPDSWKPYDLWIHGSPQTAMVGLNWLFGFIAVVAYGWNQWQRRRSAVHVGAELAGQPNTDQDGDDQPVADHAQTGDAPTGDAPTGDVATADGPPDGTPRNEPTPADGDDTAATTRSASDHSMLDDESAASTTDESAIDDSATDTATTDDAVRDGAVTDDGSTDNDVSTDDGLTADNDESAGPVESVVGTSAVGEVDWALRRRTLIAVMGLTLAWTAFAGIFIELGEQGRFRAVTDPFVLSAVLVLNWRWYAPRVQRWWAERSSTQRDVGSQTA